MDAYPKFKKRSTEILVKKAVDIYWEPEQEEEQAEELEALWDSLSPDEKADLTRWLEQQKRI